jgi:hypothetical protein
VLEHLKWGSLDYAPRFYELALKSNPKTRVFLYHFWPSLNAPDYQATFAEELQAYEKIADMTTALYAKQYPGQKVQIVPAGAAIVELKSRIERGEVPGINNIRQIYRDDIHLTPTGMYMVGLVHFATLYHTNPKGLVATMKNEWGGEIVNLQPATAAVFQEVAWEAVIGYARSGVKKE